MKKHLYLSSLIFCLLLSAACNSNPQKSTAFVKLSNRVDMLEDRTKKIENNLKGLSFDVGLLDEQVENTKKSLRAVAAGSPADSQAIEVAMKNLSQVQKQVQELEARIKTQQKAFASAIEKQESEFKARLSAQSSASRKQTNSASTGKTVATAKKPVPSKKRVARESARAEAPAKPAGFYYQVKSGDTLRSISQRYNIPLASLTKANHLPISADILPGQSIYVPRS